jgi:Ca-activated chloride channel family protein
VFFADLWLLFVLVPLYVAWVALWVVVPWWRKRHRGTASLRYSSVRQLRRLAPSKSVLLRRLVEGLRLVTVALLVLAMSRPQTGRSLTEVHTEGIDIVLVLDTSGSMQALDLDAHLPIRERRNRLEAAKDVVEIFIEGRQNDQIGLVVFGAEAFTQCPLTLDHGILATFLERLEIGMAGDATAIGSALGTAVKRLRDSDAESKVVILLTDGRSNAGSLTPIKAAEIAATFDVKVYTIGVGATGEAPFLMDSIFGQQVVHQNVEIDEATLQRIAELTGGAYYRAEDTEALEEIYRRIDELEKTEITMESYMEYNERFRWFVLPAMALLLFEVVLLGTRLRKLP